MLHLLVLASITEPLVNLATNVVGDLGLAGVFVLMVLESACIPVPHWTTWKDSLHYVDDAVAVAIVAVVGYYAVRWWRRRGGSDDGAGGLAEPEPLAESA